VVRNDEQLIARVGALAPEGVDHVVEVAFGANLEADLELLKLGGSIATYASDREAPPNPFLADGVQEHSAVLFGK
jgi:NADPH2:quinone reductase